MFYQSSFTFVSQRKHFTSDKSEADTQKGKLEVQKIYTMCLWNHFKVTFSSTSQNIISWRSFFPLHFMVVYTHPTTRGGRGRKEVALQRWNNRILWLNTKLHTGPRPCFEYVACSYREMVVLLESWRTDPQLVETDCVQLLSRLHEKGLSVWEKNFCLVKKALKLLDFSRETSGKGQSDAAHDSQTPRACSRAFYLWILPRQGRLCSSPASLSGWRTCIWNRGRKNRWREACGWKLIEHEGRR